MGILQTAYRTYQMLSQTEGIFDYRDDGTEPLAPVSHILQNAQIEITLTDEGKFLSAVPVSKGDESTIIPATEESADRSRIRSVTSLPISLPRTTKSTKPIWHC